MGTSMPDELVIRTLPFAEWRRDISPLWAMEGSYRFIQRTIGGSGQMQYVGRERLRRVLLFPIVAELDHQAVGWTSVFNISDEAVRVRGIYVLPGFRSSGIGRKMVNYALGRWPLPWRTAFMYAREANVERYLRWGFALAPQHQLRSWEMNGVQEQKIVLMQKELQQAS
jgi:GNAT superfamily N-acetyltransferase